MRGTLGTEQADDGRKNGDDGNHGNNIVNVLADVGDEMSQRVAAEDHGANPEDAAKNVKEQIAGIRHFCGTGHRWAKCSNDGHESREDHGAATVFLVELMGALEMAAAEKEGVFAAIKGGACGTANPIANLVAGNGAKHDREQKPLEGNDAGVREDAGGDQKRVARKKKAHEEPSFYKDYGANQRSATRAD